jgi:hypothetical protein
MRYRYDIPREEFLLGIWLRNSIHAQTLYNPQQRNPEHHNAQHRPK